MKRPEKRPIDVRNHLDKDSTAPNPNAKWATDITYIRTAENWLYRSIVLDLHSDVVVGWSMSRCQDRHLVIQAVLMALWQRKEPTPVILHSDSEYMRVEARADIFDYIERFHNPMKQRELDGQNQGRSTRTKLSCYRCKTQAFGSRIIGNAAVEGLSRLDVIQPVLLSFGDRGIAHHRLL